MATTSLSRSNPFEGPSRRPTSRLIPGVYITDHDAPARFKGHDLWVTRLSIDFGRSEVDVEAPYVAGRRVHDIGRNGWIVEMIVRWDGTDWWQRLFNFVAVIDSQSSPDWLDLPTRRGSIFAKGSRGKIDWDTIKENCEMSFTFKEDTNDERVDLLAQLHTSPLTQAQTMVPTDAPEVQSAVDDYATAVRDPNTTEDERASALQDVYSTIEDERADCDVDTAEGCEREDDLWTVQRQCQDAYPGDTPPPPNGL
jgi:hypothetical protein